MRFDEPVSRWDEAIPLGNGKMGCLIWGNGAPLKFSLDRGDLWDYRAAPEISDPAYTFASLIDLVEARNQDEIASRFENGYNRPTPTKIPAGRLELHYGADCSGAVSRLALADALAEVRLEFAGQRSTVRSFLHATEFYGFISISGDMALPDLIIKMPEYSTDSAQQQDEIGKLNPDIGIVDGLKLLGYPSAIHITEGNVSLALQNTCTDLSYAIIAAVQKRPDGMDIAFATASSLDGPDWLEAGRAQVALAATNGFARCFASHVRWWRDYFWPSSSITLPDPQLEKLWYMNNYLFGSCSRKGFLPMPLQGLWTADDGGLPPWKGDYHHNQNTQQCYSHYMKANHLEEGSAMIDLLWKLVPVARQFARQFYDAPGLSLPSIMSPDGTALGGWATVSGVMANQIWICQMFDHYWRFSGDERFLEEQAYPYFRESALCLLRWLQPDEGGKLRLPLSTSPERYGNDLKAWLIPDSNYDLGLMKYLFSTLRDMAGLLRNGEAEIWSGKLGMLDDYVLDENGVLMVAKDEPLKESYLHHAHAMAIYPLDLLNYDLAEDRRIIDATIHEMERLGCGFWVGYSFPWMSLIYTRQRNGAAAAYQLKLFADAFCSRNGFNLNGDFRKLGVSSIHYRPFTLEGNMAAAAAIQEMLLQNRGEVIRVFPAIPPEWSKRGASFRGLRAERGVLVSAEISGRQLQYIALTATRRGEYAVENFFDAAKLRIRRTNSESMVACEPGSILRIRLDEAESCVIDAGRTPAG